jgi:3-oxoacyl-[acyl-carrier-protein] synthase II
VRICISGLGVVSPLGIGREAFWTAIAEGRNGISEADLFDRSGLGCGAAGQVRGFDAAGLLGSKGLRYIDRPSQFALAAAQLALIDAAVNRDQIPPERIGIVLGTAFGNQSSLEDCNRERIVDGPQYLSPAKFPNTPINALSYQIPIRHQMRLVNTTVSSGMNSGFDALLYATFVLRRFPDAVLLCGGVDELSRNTYFSCYFRHELAGTSGPELSCPFDRRRNGYVLGEGAAIAVVETREALDRRGGSPIAELAGFGSATPMAPGIEGRVEAAATAVRGALRDAGLEPADVDYIAAGADAHPELDLVEAQMIGRVFGDRARCVPVGAVKSMTGEAYAASNGYQIASAVLALQRGVLTRTINLDEPDSACAVAHAASAPSSREVRHVLVSSVDRFGQAVALIVGRPA